MDFESKFDKSILSKEEHPENIYDVFVTDKLLKLGKINEVRDLHP